MFTSKMKVILALLTTYVLAALMPAALAASPVIVTPDTLGQVHFDADGVYQFEGAFDSVAITTSAGKSITLDGSRATFSGQIKITLGIIANNKPSLVAARTGNYTVQNFTTLSSLSVGSCSADSVLIKNNQVGALDLNCSNSGVVLSSNAINSTISSYPRHDGASHSGGLYVYADNYNLTLTSNQITSLAGAMTVLGNYEHFQSGNSASLSNQITMTGNTLKASDIFKIWNDVSYAPVEWPAEYTATSAMLNLAKQIVSQNDVTLDCDGTLFDVLMRISSAAQNSTEKNFNPFKKIADDGSPKFQHSNPNGSVCSLCGEKIAASVASVPTTGDASHLELWFSLMILAAVGMVIACKRRTAAQH